MKLLSFPFAIIALSTVALSVGCGKSGGDDTSTQTTDTGTPIVDADFDGVAIDDDCDDTDANLGAVAEDGDCDGWLTADDCDDADTGLGAVAEDSDCDGWLTADDCDDADAGLGAVAEDGDCDGWLTADDCDDADVGLGAVAYDADCDGWLTADDCDDNDFSLNFDDLDNDGYSTCDGDCDDGDATLELDDLDGDGYSTCGGDCDDTDPGLESADLDGDGYSTCDGDCDDTTYSVLDCTSHPGGGGMVLLSAGTFDMGCTPAQAATGECTSMESPAHSVTLTHDFYMGETEITQDEYAAIMGVNPSYFLTCINDCPVEQVSWHDAAEYANALSVADGLTECFVCSNGSCNTGSSPYTCDGYRLPTEAEWEYAARAGTDYLYAGSDTVGDVSWYSANSNSRPNTVAQLAPNDWGLYDMSGNAQEWIWDWLENTYPSSASYDPEGPTSGTYRTVRGGGYYYDASYQRVSYRSLGDPNVGNLFIGFRLARSIP